MKIEQALRKEKLTTGQWCALNVLRRGTLYRARGGWGPNGGLIAAATITALQSRGLCTVSPLGGCMGSADISQAGREALARIEGSHSVGDATGALTERLHTHKPRYGVRAQGAKS